MPVVFLNFYFPNHLSKPVNIFKVVETLTGYRCAGFCNSEVSQLH